MLKKLYFAVVVTIISTTTFGAAYNHQPSQVVKASQPAIPAVIEQACCGNPFCPPICPVEVK